MINLSNMKKTIVLFKPSGTISISGDLLEIQRKFYDGLLYNIKEEIDKEGDKKFFTVALSDLKKLLNTTEQNKNNTYYKTQLKKLSKIQVEYNILGKDKTIEGFANLVTEGEFVTNKETGEVLFKYNIPTRVKDAIKSKKGIFAKIDLMIKKNLKHRYSLILYDLIKDYENVEIPEMSILEFRKIFGVEDKYKLFQNLKKRVLEPALIDINNNKEINFTIEYELAKRGSKYTHIKFKKVRKQAQKKIEQVKTTQKIDLLLQYVPEKYKLPVKKLLNKELNNYPLEYLQYQIKYANKQENIKNYTAYLQKAIKEDYADFEHKAEREAKTRKQREEMAKQEQETRKKLEKLRKKMQQIEDEAEKEFENFPEAKKEKMIEKNMSVFANKKIARMSAIGEIARTIMKKQMSKEDIEFFEAHKNVF